MNLAGLSLQRPVATMMLWLAVIVAGVVCWTRLPISALPQVESPTIEVTAKLPGASPENMSTSVATPLEKEFSSIPGLVGSTSQNIQGETKIQLEFDLGRDIDAAAVDVQAALFRMGRSLPAEMPTPPTYAKVNPGDAPILQIGLSSPTMPLSELNAYVDDLVVPTLSTINGVAQVIVKGGKRYAVRAAIDPERLAALDLSLIDVNNALKTANSITPLGQLDNPRQTLALQMPRGLMKAADFADVAVAVREGRTIRLSDLGRVYDSIENTQNTSEVNGSNSVLLQIKRQPGANTVATIDAVRAILPRLRGQLPDSVEIQTLGDRSQSIRDAIHDVNMTLLLTIALVILVILLFLRRLSAALIPSISLPLSLFATFGLMYWADLSLDNISLMGLTIAVGLVVDDAIVVLENIMRYIEQGLAPREAALRGAREVGFTVLSISISLVAVFIPIFLMRDLSGALFHEFAIVVSLAILVSAAVSLTLIPVLVPMLIKEAPAHDEARGWNRAFEAGFARVLDAYRRTLELALAHRNVVLFVGATTVALTAALYVAAPKGLFPQEDTGQIAVKIKTAEDMSYEGRLVVLRKVQTGLLADPAIAAVASKVDHDTTALTIDLKPRDARPAMPQVLERLRANAARLPGITVNFSPVQNLKVGASTSDSAFEYTLQSVGADELDPWSRKLLAELSKSGVFAEIDRDYETNGLEAQVEIDRDKAAQLGIDMASLRTTLHAAFGTRQVSTIYAQQASYQVIMELADESRRDETDLSRVFLRGGNGALIPLDAIAKVKRGNGTTMVAHKAQLPAITFSFELARGKSLSDAADAIASAREAIAMPQTLFGSFGGQAGLFEKSRTSQLWLIAIAVAAIYLVLGVLYESWIHPLTILLGLPSAAVGALLALRLLGMELTFIAMIGMLLLIGVVKKNAIMMIDFALDAQRSQGLPPEQAIRQACLLRFRPITMTTLCALAGALPIALGLGAGAELRQPLGVVIVGGMLFSQFITLYITPVLYLWFDSIGARRHRRADASAMVAPVAH
ncbi:MAG: efflux RND transporter permease subunit [Rudaea sp.]|uniref:efflux RND transporter permease subunit n=1 Tax=unclassified Rudaea TaxID=2627037 RepID=UPI0010F87A4E|nr:MULTISPECIES: efflux RND transporter permease subunit [unclassified Rudaea]MBN8886157.1 efflux RND transporter permease subunit [Rudaea sp.]MBR0345844.1 efflux RND transporter permease subunit [Rudaea sp.]